MRCQRSGSSERNSDVPEALPGRVDGQAECGRSAAAWATSWSAPHSRAAAHKAGNSSSEAFVVVLLGCGVERGSDGAVILSSRLIQPGECAADARRDMLENFGAVAVGGAFFGQCLCE